MSKKTIKGADNYPTLSARHFPDNMTKPTDTVDEQLDRFTVHVHGEEHRLKPAEKAALKALLARQVYGFHEYIIGKNIIRPEAGQAFNYARLHHAIDDYIAELKATTTQKENT